MNSYYNFGNLTKLNQYIHHRFSGDKRLRSVEVRGEISNYNPRPSNHQFFELKDSSASINAIMYKNYAQSLTFQLKEGLDVTAYGWVSTYTARDEVQFYVKHLVPSGTGAMYHAFLDLNHRLANRGWYDTAHKQQIPQFPQRIAIITSPYGNVIHDIMKTVDSRWPSTQMVLYPASVQGPLAEPTLISQLKAADATHSFDDIIIGRGGGSVDSLQAFNSERLARTIYYCQTPVISSVGHGNNHTICDRVADLSVVTPTAAAEEATPDIVIINHSINKKLIQLRQSVYQALSNQVARLNNLMGQLKSSTKQRLTILSDRLNSDIGIINAHNPEQILASDTNRFNFLIKELWRHTNHLLNIYSQAVYSLRYTLRFQTKHYLAQATTHLEQDRSGLKALSPLNTLKRGFSITTSQNQIIKDQHQVKPGQVINVRFRSGALKAVVVLSKHRKDN